MSRDAFNLFILHCCLIGCG